MTVHVLPQHPIVQPVIRIAFIGEAPGTEELERLQPLVGPAGRTFNAMLRTAGIDRYATFISNVFDEKLPDNKVSNWTVDLAEARKQEVTDIPPIGAAGFLAREHRWQLERLRRELLSAKPNVIVPLGGTALWAFTGTDQIGSHRGAIIPAKYIVPGAKLLPTFHPMFVQHSWKFFPVVVGDFIKAEGEAARGPEIVLPKRELLLEPTLEDIREYLPRLKSSDLLSVDIETGWGQITCIGFAPDAEHAICIPFLDKRTPTRNYWATHAEELAAWGMVRAVLEGDTPKLGQNYGAYDVYWLLEKHGIKTRNLIHDTRLMHHALYPELPKSLSFMGASYTTQGVWKSWGKRQKEKRDD